MTDFTIGGTTQPEHFDIEIKRSDFIFDPMPLDETGLPFVNAEIKGLKYTLDCIKDGNDTYEAIFIVSDGTERPTRTIKHFHKNDPLMLPFFNFIFIQLRDIVLGKIANPGTHSLS